MVVAFALAVFLLTGLPCLAQTPADVGVLEVELSPTEITVGDRVEARLILIWTGPAPAAEPRFPAWRKTWGGAEILSAGEVLTLTGPDDRRVYRQTLVLTAFTTGQILLPEVTVALPLAAETIEVASGRDAGFEVRSVLPEDAAEAEPRPAAPPRVLDGESRFARTAGGLGGLSLLLAWLVGRRLHAPRTSTATAPATPLVELLQRLRELDPAAAEPAHTGLSLGLRDFLSHSLGVPAAESTTTEIERGLRRARLEPEAADGTIRLLRDCDQVKFARAPVPAPVTLGRLRQARDLGSRIDRVLAGEEAER